MVVLLPLCYTIIFIWIISRLKYFRLSGLPFRKIAFFFLLKILAGLGLTLVYTYHYKDRSTADIYKYFDDAKAISNGCKNEPTKYLRLLSGIDDKGEDLKECLSQTRNWYEKAPAWLQYTGTKDFNFFNSNQFVIRFNLIVLWFSFGNFYVHIIFVCFLSLTGLIGIFNTLKKHMPGKEIILSYILFFLPSVLFWGSGVLKEGLLIGFLGIFLHLFLPMAVEQKKRIAHKTYQIIAAALMLFLILFCKYYVLAALLPGIVAQLWIHHSENKTGVLGQRQNQPHLLIRYLIIYTGLFILNYSISCFKPDFNALKVISDKRHEAIYSAISLKAQSILFVDDISPDPLSFLSEMPEAIINVFASPFPWKCNSAFTWFASIENMLMIAFCLGCLFFRKKPFYGSPLFSFFLSYTLMMILIIGYTTAVSGNLIRFKILFTPFLAIMFLLISDKEKAKAFLEKIYKRGRSSGEMK